MSVNGITGYGNANEVAYQQTKQAEKKETTQEQKKTTNDKGVVYESSNAKVDNKALIAKLKADTNARTEQLRSLVEKMFLKQGKKAESADDMWKILASGDFEVDPETAAKAKSEISEDGYWGVKQTSQRIFDFAVALSGGDEDKMNDMLDAFKKGFSQATKSWGKSLPDISSRTYDAVLEKFKDYKNDTSAI